LPTDSNKVLQNNNEEASTTKPDNNKKTIQETPIVIDKIINTPGLLNAAALRAKILAEEDKIALIRKELTLDSVKEIWNDYLNKSTSKSTQTALNNTIIGLENNFIKVFTPTSYVKDIILLETGLIEDIRNKMHRDDILLDIKVDVNQFPDYNDVSAIKLKLSPRELYTKMQEKNKDLSIFINTLELRLDQE
jgi:hypothetical protein